MALLNSFRAIRMSARISAASRGDIGAGLGAFDETCVGFVEFSCACAAAAANANSAIVKRALRLIALLLLRARAYGWGLGLSAGFLLPPKIPKILSRSPFFFSGSFATGSLDAASVESPVEPLTRGLLEGLDALAAELGGMGGGGGFPFPGLPNP